MMSRIYLCLASLVWSWLALAAHAFAQAAPAEPPLTPQAVELQFATQPGCPSEAEFVDEVLARVRLPVKFGGSEPSIHIIVKLEQATDGARGELELRREAAAATQRDFSASSCAEVGSALALVAALTLDPNARTEALPARAASVPVTAAQAPTPAPTTSPVQPQPPSPVPPLPTPRPEPALRSRYSAWIGPVAAIGWGDAPKVLGLFGLGLGVRRISASPLSPSVQLTPLWGKTGTTGPASTTGEFSWAMGRLELCPASFRLTPASRLDPCAAAELGQLTAHGLDAAVAVPDTVQRWWLAVGATLSLHLDLSDWFFIRFGAATLFPLTRDEFVFDLPVRRVHRASAVSLGGQLGLGFQLGQ